MPRPRFPRKITGNKPKQREVLNPKIGSPETPKFWEDAARRLAEKGLTEAADASKEIAEKLRRQGKTDGAEFNPYGIRRKTKS